MRSKNVTSVLSTPPGLFNLWYSYCLYCSFFGSYSPKSPKIHSSRVHRCKVDRVIQGSQSCFVVGQSDHRVTYFSKLPEHNGQIWTNMINILQASDLLAKIVLDIWSLIIQRWQVKTAGHVIIIINELIFSWVENWRKKNLPIFFNLIYFLLTLKNILCLNHN